MILTILLLNKVITCFLTFFLTHSKSVNEKDRLCRFYRFFLRRFSVSAFFENRLTLFFCESFFVEHFEEYFELVHCGVFWNSHWIAFQVINSWLSQTKSQIWLPRLLWGHDWAEIIKCLNVKLCRILWVNQLGNKPSHPRSFTGV